MAMTGSLNSCRGAGPAEATEPPPHFRVVLGQRARLWPKVHVALVEGLHRDAPLARTVGLRLWGATRPEDASVAIQVQLGVNNGDPPPPRTPPPFGSSRVGGRPV